MLRVLGYSRTQYTQIGKQVSIGKFEAGVPKLKNLAQGNRAPIRSRRSGQSTQRTSWRSLVAGPRGGTEVVELSAHTNLMQGSRYR